MKQGDVILFVGPPGAGKGSISQRCCKELGWVHLSTGNLCRKHISEQTDIGKEIDFAIKSGKLVSDKLIVDMIVDWFDSQKGKFHRVILDGSPRTVAQAKALVELGNQALQEVKFWVIRLVVPDEIVIERLSSRFICRDNDCQTVYSTVPGSQLAPKEGMVCDLCDTSLVRRKDDEPVAIEERLKTYYKHEQALLDFYRIQGQVIHELEVNAPLDEVFEDFRRIIGV